MPEPSKHAQLEMITIYEISKVLTSSLDMDKTVRETLGILRSHLAMRRGRVSMVHEDGQVLPLGASPGTPQPEQEQEFDRRVVALVLRNGSPLAVADVARDAHFEQLPAAMAQASQRVALLAVPVKNAGRVDGVLWVCLNAGGERPIHFERDLRVLSLVANLLGQSWQLHRSVAAERRQLIEDKQRLQKQLQGRYDIENVIGKSARMKEVFADVHLAAPGSATVLLRGESGTGKEAIANAVHYLSPRTKGPFVKVNCAALTETLLESELFGHEKGAFTGATSERKGRFELASGGTLFLDEIGDVSPGFQAKLLRVLQERDFERVGGTRTIKTDFRLVAATNRNLEEMVKKGEFRADLYFRLNVVSIHLPALRERKDDIPLLVDFFLDRYNRENARALAITPGAVNVLKHCNWPGNVRELENCIERTATMTRGRLIAEADMRCQRGQCFSSMLLETGRSVVPVVAAPAAEAKPAPVPSGAGAADEVLEASRLPERERLIQAMEKCGWVQAKAARLLDLTPRQIGYALRKLNIEVKRL